MLSGQVPQLLPSRDKKWSLRPWAVKAVLTSGTSLGPYPFLVPVKKHRCSILSDTLQDYKLPIKGPREDTQEEGGSYQGTPMSPTCLLTRGTQTCIVTGPSWVGVGPWTGGKFTTQAGMDEQGEGGDTVTHTSESSLFWATEGSGSQGNMNLTFCLGKCPPPPLHFPA